MCPETPRSYLGVSAPHPPKKCQRLGQLCVKDKQLASEFLNGLLNQLNWSFSEIGMLQEVCHSVNFVAMVIISRIERVWCLLFLQLLPNIFRWIIFHFLDITFKCPYDQILDIREFMAAMNFSCSKKWRHFLKNATRVKIVVIISTATRIKNNWSFRSYVCVIFYANWLYSQPVWYFWENEIHFLKFLTKTWNKEN